MLIGGMFDVDVELGMKTANNKSLALPCDTQKKYITKEYTNNGRTATVLALTKGLKLTAGDVVLLPEYNCISIVNALEVAGVDFEFYRVREGLIVDLQDMEQKITPKVKAIYVIHYFGTPQPQYVVDGIKELAQKYNLLSIEDLTQSLFTSMPGRIGWADYIVSSTRKWFPMTDGGVMAVRNDMMYMPQKLPPAYDEAAYTQMFLALSRIYYGSKESLEDDSYSQLEVVANSKRYLDFTPKGMTTISENILFQSDVDALMEKRRDNYKALYERLLKIKEVTIISSELKEADGVVPFGLLIYTQKRAELVNYLKCRKIIPEIQWKLPTQYYTPSEYAMNMSLHSLMLQCDQRYDIKDMDYTADVIEKFFNTEE